jgi:hypothetical protein
MIWPHWTATTHGYLRDLYHLTTGRDARRDASATAGYASAIIVMVTVSAAFEDWSTSDGTQESDL